MSEHINKKLGNNNKPTGKNKKKIKVFTGKNKRKIPETILIKQLQEKYEQIDVTSIKSFDDFPLSKQTLKGLKDCGYLEPTEIQRETIGLSLQGKDVLGASQTGSGKTLAFLVPILEILYNKQWTHLDGVGALVITPTRELAYQIFEMLRKVGTHHEFSAALVIGGKDLKFERKRMDQCNIVICTPGRLLQHMDENPLLDCVNMQILVLDEADRCLDMGFEKTMNAIIANLPLTRQTLLFSATQTKSVKDLARLSLKDPSYISVHEHSKYSTPAGLQQNYVICELQDKLSIIWSFLKNHKKTKCIIFFASCKQVKYIYEIFCKLRPGISLLALYGTLHQLRRMEIYESFCRKESAVLFSTDIAARGLDFPQVNWVIQADCPEDSATYIHRVGRTARYQRNGESLLLLLPSEKAMIPELEERKIPVNKIEINPLKLQNPVRKMEAFLASSPSLKDSAKRAFMSYIKSVFLMKNKKVFQVEKLDTDSFSKSLGLVIPPRIRFLQRRNIQHSKIDVTERFSEDVPKIQNNTFHVSEDIESDDADDDVLKVKRKDHDIDQLLENETVDLIEETKKKKKPATRAALAKKLLHKNILPNKKTVFDDEGEEVVQGTKQKRSELAREYENENEGGIDIEKARMVLKEEDKFDKELFKEKVKAQHKEKKRKLKQKKKEDDEKDSFGSESEEEPDLSWLPDPDKIYGKKDHSEGENNADNLDEIEENSDNSESNSDIEESNSKSSYIEDDEIVYTKSKKRSLTNTNQHQHKKRKLEDLSKSLSVKEAEELAMMFLKK